MPRLSPRTIALSGLLLITVTGAATRPVQASQACREVRAEASRKKQALGLRIVPKAAGQILRTRHETQKATISNIR